MKTKRTGFILLITVVCLILTNTKIFAQQTATQLYEKALYMEEAKGELQQAIDLYQQILKDNPENRQVSAKALLHMGMCYEKMGLKQAWGMYEDVINKYSEQTDEVSTARKRLANLEQIMADFNQKPTFRKIEIATNPQNGVLSPDGNRLAFFSDGAVWIVPLHGKVNQNIAGEPILLANIPGGWDNGTLMSWSADGKWIAVNAVDLKEVADEKEIVYIIPVDGGKPRLVEMIPRGDYAFNRRLGLSHDGDILTFSALELGKTESFPLDRSIYTIPTLGGQPVQLISGMSNMPSYSPNDQFIAYIGYSMKNNDPDNDEMPNGDLWVVSAKNGKSVKLSNINGRLGSPIWSPDRKYIATILDEEIIIYPFSPDKSTTEDPTKIMLPGESSNMLAGWTPDNELGIFIQSEQRDAIYTVPSTGGKAVQVSPDGLGPNYPRWSPDGKRIYFRGYNKEKGSRLLFIPATGGNTVEIPVLSDKKITSCIPGGGLNISPDGKKIVISRGTMEPESDESNLYTILLDSGLPVRLSGDKSIDGYYPCWSPCGRWIAYIEHTQVKTNDRGFYAIYIIPSEGGEIKQITSVADSVGRGAIAFSPDGKNIAFFSGSAIKTVPVEGGQSKVLVENISFDMWSQLAYSPDGKKIAHCAGGKNIWITSLDEGKPQVLQTDLPKNARQHALSWSPDSKKIAFRNNIGGNAEFWLISDFLPKKKTVNKQK